MRKFLLSASAVVGILGATSLAAAAPADTGGLAGKGSLFISAERVFGLQINSIKTERPAAGNTTEKVTYSSTDFGLLYGNPSGVTDIARNPYTLPQIALDYAVIDSLTIGGSIGFWVGSNTRTTEPGNGSKTENPGPSTNSFKLSPRVGYIIGVSDSFGIWLRGGFTFFRGASSSESTGTPKTTSTNSVSGFALNLEPGVILMVNQHFGFGANINVDVPLQGKFRSENSASPTVTEYDAKFWNFGLTLGVIGKI
ncbi:MAG: hypothetical protein JNL79_06390 [Myxococcales bacterium]|nr:hypothetical protein [Myxococcales bacterium]